mmetsp:Transcript_37454/g.83355  ORF Transcript_37454/g.83355 Transcript_37454/m.83355 type:complete len:271 (+) Transcript_37454:38-850(+)
MSRSIVAQAHHVLTRGYHLRTSVSQRLCVRALSKVEAPIVKRGATFYAPSEESLGYLASLLAQNLSPGDCYCLHGDVGAGKSVFSRAFIREVAQDDYLPVPSPTYLLQNVYDDHGDPPIHHFDLYRLTSNTDLGRLSLAESWQKAVSLVEWADRLEGRMPEQRLSIHIKVMDDLSEGQDGLFGMGPRPMQPGQQPAGSSTSQTATQSPLDEEGTIDLGEEVDLYTDRRWRQVVLEPHGPHWQARVADVLHHVISDDSTRGLILVAADGGS